MQRGFVNGIFIPGWTCTCGVFNSAEKGWLTHCRACGEARYTVRDTTNEYGYLASSTPHIINLGTIQDIQRLADETEALTVPLASSRIPMCGKYYRLGHGFDKICQKPPNHPDDCGLSDAQIRVSKMTNRELEEATKLPK